MSAHLTSITEQSCHIISSVQYTTAADLDVCRYLKSLQCIHMSRHIYYHWHKGIMYDNFR